MIPPRSPQRPSCGDHPRSCWPGARRAAPTRLLGACLESAERRGALLAALLLALLGPACHDDDDLGAGAGGSAATGSSAGSPGTGGLEPPSGGGQGGSPFAQLGVCGQRGEATATATRFNGTEEYYLLGDEGFGDPICVVSFEITRAGDAPAGCDAAGSALGCAWTHRVEYSNPVVITDVDDACASSALAMTAARIAAVEGSHEDYGFVAEYAGHSSVLMRHDTATAAWVPFGNATWDAATGALRFDHRAGYCGY